MADQDREPGPAPAAGESASAPPQDAQPQPAPVPAAPPPRSVPVQAATPQPSPPPRRPAAINRGPLWVGLVLVFIGVGLLVQMFVPGLRLWEYWPVVFIVWGLLVIVRARGRG